MLYRDGTISGLKIFCIFRFCCTKTGFKFTFFCVFFAFILLYLKIRYWIAIFLLLLLSQHHFKILIHIL